MALVRSPKKGDGDEIWGVPWISRGQGGIKNRQGVWWDVIWFVIDTRPSLIGLCCEKDGSQAQLSLDQMCADVSPHHQWPFWKWWARGTEICHVEQSQRRRWGCRNQVTNLIPLVTIYCPWQIGSLLKRGTEECSHLNQHNNYKYPLYICLPAYACTHHYWLSMGGINVCCAVPESFMREQKAALCFFGKH